MTEGLPPLPRAPLRGTRPYSSPHDLGPGALMLNANETRAPGDLESWSVEPVVAPHGYPDRGPLTRVLADRLGLEAERVIVTAGADDALARLMEAFLDSSDELAMVAPSFIMIERFAGLRGAKVARVPWMEGPLPTEELLSRGAAGARILAVVSPNNPTGATATREEIAQLCTLAPESIVLLDHAYVEFGGEDLTALVLDHPNLLVMRTFSKARGLAAARVGYAVGHPSVITALDAAGGPYPCSAFSLNLALASLREGEATMQATIARARTERELLARTLEELGLRVRPSAGNFLLVETPRAAFVHRALASLGIHVRAFSSVPELEDALRISMPLDEASFERLEGALRTILMPDALLFDVDGVLVEVGASYREAILGTVRSFGGTLEASDITAAKHAGGANCDWELSHRFLNEQGKDLAFDDVVQRFESLYQGTDDEPGYKTRETALIDRETIDRMGRSRALGIVTGRPRKDALEFLDREGLRGAFDAVLTRDDGPLKPDPWPCAEAARRLEARTAWMIGDTPDDIRAGRAAGFLAIGVRAPGDATEATTRALEQAGAAIVLDRVTDLEDLLG